MFSTNFQPISNQFNPFFDHFPTIFHPTIVHFLGQFSANFQPIFSQFSVNFQSIFSQFSVNLGPDLNQCNVPHVKLSCSERQKSNLHLSSTDGANSCISPSLILPLRLPPCFRLIFRYLLVTCAANSFIYDEIRRKFPPENEFQESGTIRETEKCVPG